jgi:hypothetical protein
MAISRQVAFEYFNNTPVPAIAKATFYSKAAKLTCNDGGAWRYVARKDGRGGFRTALQAILSNSSSAVINERSARSSSP